MPCSLTAVWLLVLPAACSVDLSSLKAGCAAPLVNCKGKCASSCSTGAGGGSSGSDIDASGADSGGLADAAGQPSGGQGEPGGTGSPGGSGDMAGAGDSGGSGAVGGNPLVCTTVSYPFHYTPQPPTFPVPTMSIVASGDWNGWTSMGVALTAGEDGTYRGVADVPVGDRLYKFFIDGKKWVQDPDNPNSIGDGFDGRNSELTLKCGVDYSSAGGPGVAGQSGI